MNSQPIISVICPTYNEEKYIEKILLFFVESLPKEKELFIIDGGSTDRTASIVEEWKNKHSSITLLNNPNKYVPFALNLGLQNASGKFIVRLDAHTSYEKNYFEKIIETFKNTDADIVGGPMNAMGNTNIQKAIAFATSGWFGIGNSKFHNVNFSGYTDSVYLGAWKKEIFEDVGNFDEQMKRNQDDEFHYRAKSQGKIIYLNSEIKSTYFPRTSFKTLFSQYFQYGLYKPLVIKKVKSEIKIRHLVPLFFVLYLFSLIFALIFPFVLIPLVIYLLINFYVSFTNSNSMSVKLATLLVHPILHISYGSGFLFGIFKSKK